MYLSVVHAEFWILGRSQVGRRELASRTTNEIDLFVIEKRDARMGSLGKEPGLLQVAIVGTGIAGLTAAIALRRHPNINVELYEKATELKEIGASITLGPNGLRTLQRLGLEDCISDKVGYRGPNPISRFYRHWKTNEIIGEDFYENVSEPLHYTARFHRGHLQQAFLKHVPRDSIHLKKRLVSATVDSQGGVQMQFQDGSSSRADILIGADGIRSGVRTAFAPNFELKWSGHTAFRGIFDASLVDSIDGVPLDSTHWWGPDTNFFATRLAQNLFTVQGGIYADPEDPVAISKFRDGAPWDQEANIKILREKYLDWNPVVKSLANVTPDIRYYPNYFCGSSLPTWIFGGRVTFDQICHPETPARAKSHQADTPHTLRACFVTNETSLGRAGLTRILAFSTHRGVYFVTTPTSHSAPRTS
ncbi:salicylate 1-monooxygenase [Diplocarpon mali]|nr:salicylate 1-monooxygenase [Diplocarpon mali]